MPEKVNLRLTHPTLFWMAVSFALGSIGFGMNFLLTEPTFNPYGISYNIIGAIFIFLGSAKLTALLVIKSLKSIRITMASCSVFMMFWGFGTSITFFQGKTSLQLFVAFLLLATLQWLLLLEPFVNPLTGGNGHADDK